MKLPFNAVETLAIAKIVSKDNKEKQRAAVAPGKYPFDISMHIKGVLTVGDDYMRAPTVSIPVLEVLALFIARAGITRERSESLLVDCLTAAMSKNDGKAQGQIASVLPQVAATLERVQKEVISKLPLAKVNGQTRATMKIACMSAETLVLSADALQDDSAIAQSAV